MYLSSGISLLPSIRTASPASAVTRVVDDVLCMTTLSGHGTTFCWATTDRCQPMAQARAVSKAKHATPINRKVYFPPSWIFGVGSGDGDGVSGDDVDSA